MAIVSSSYVSDAHAQSGGGFLTTESFTDGNGNLYTNTYLWDGVTSRDDLLAARAAALSVRLADEEANAMIGQG